MDGQDDGLDFTKSKQLWEEFYKNNTLHGFRSVFDSKGPRRIFWLVLVVVAFVFAYLLFQGVILGYLSYEIYISKQIVFEFDEIIFPRITICNVNTISAKSIRRQKFEHINQTHLLEFYRNFFKDETIMENSEFVDTLKKRNLTNLREVFQMFDREVKESVADKNVMELFGRYCQFDGKPCKSSNFSEVFSIEYGRCLGFPQYETVPHKGYTKYRKGGLKIFLDIHETDYLDNEKVFNGLLVFVHPFHDYYNSFLSRKIAVQPGTMNFIHMSLQKVHSLPYPYRSNCGEKGLNYFPSNVTGYSRNLCRVECKLKHYQENCNCTFKLHFAKISRSRECQLKDYKCITRALRDSTYKKCQKRCPVQCSHVFYNTRLAQVGLGTRFLYDKFAKIKNINISESREYIRQNIVGLHINYGDTMFTKETMLPSVQWESLFGNIGGTLGLCLGCSL